MSTSYDPVFEHNSCDNVEGQYALCMFPLHETVELRSGKEEPQKFFVNSGNAYPWFYSTDGHRIVSHPNQSIGMLYYNKYNENKVKFPEAMPNNAIGRLFSDGSSYMTLTACSRIEFTCSNGQCIPLESRCNGVNNCLDKSDEICQELKPFETSYTVIFPPVMWTPLQIEIFLKKLHDVDVSTNSVYAWFTVSNEQQSYPVLPFNPLPFNLLVNCEICQSRFHFQMNTKWYDYRLETTQLSDDYLDNKVTNNKIWTPKYDFPNAMFKDNLQYRKAANILFETLIKKEGNGSFSVVNGYEGEIL
ncbi:hypothetical protein SK128_025364 [Halocaridina rubra]|uniref:Uncharacterized protein n=1 Tax=Halocaridina rubra TaxID=373956 RepID=A0AAN8XIA4_HALRR